MEAPFIGTDGYYAVHVMWLDPIDMDKHVADQTARRYIVNKRSSTVHSKGWEQIWAQCVDDELLTVQDGNYVKLATNQSKLIADRQQSWMLKDHEAGTLPKDAVFPVAKAKAPRLRPGQRQPNAKGKQQPKPAAPKRGKNPQRTAGTYAQQRSFHTHLTLAETRSSSTPEPSDSDSNAKGKNKKKPLAANAPKRGRKPKPTAGTPRNDTHFIHASSSIPTSAEIQSSSSSSSEASDSESAPLNAIQKPKQKRQR